MNTNFNYNILFLFAVVVQSCCGLSLGKIIFLKLCASILRDDPLKIRHAYVDIALAKKESVFEDLINIFKSFK